MKAHLLIAAGWFVSLGGNARGAAVPHAPATLAAVENVPPASLSLSAPRPVLRAVRVEKGPVIDGRLDDEVWFQAPIGTPLYDADQHPGQPMIARTEFRVLYDRHNLYIGVWCFDPNPKGIVGRVMLHEGNASDDDYFYVMLDPFHDRRNGYLFLVNPVGGRMESLVTENIVVNRDWDGIWQARTSIDQAGWKAEIAIPLKTLSFDPALSTWGLNLERTVRRTGERGRWASPRREAGGYMPSEAGDLTGLDGLKQGLGLEFTPYIKGKWARQDSANDWTGDAGGDVRYRITPNLSATVSYRTDFAETEVDLRQINFTRFPLFFPEKRAFFLEDSGIFEFAGLGQGSGLGRPLIPYFSRRIGLSDQGEPVPILLAAKTAGRVGPYSLGLLDTVLDEHDALGRRNAFVGRLSRNVFEQSSVGALATMGDPNSETNNALFGPDFNFRTSRFLGNRLLEGHVFALGTYTENQSNELGYSYGASVAYPNDPVQARFDYLEIDDAFRPALGYVQQTGVRGYGAELGYHPRPVHWPTIRHLVFETRNAWFTDLDNSLDHAMFRLTPLGIHFDSDDECFVAVERQFDRPRTDFEISDGVVIPAGEYWWNQAGAGVQLAGKRLVSGALSAWLGEFYDGHRQRYSASMKVLPWKHLGFGVDYSFNRVRLPGGDFDTHLVSGRMVWMFTPNLAWSHLIQYDTQSASVGYNSRLEWEYHPGSKLFLVLNQNYLDEAGALRLDRSEVTVKLQAVFRF